MRRRPTSSACSGVNVAKIEIDDHDARDGLARFLHGHRPELLVVATHGREGINRWLRGSVTDDVIHRTHIPTLMIGPESRGFVNPGSGALGLTRILMPILPEPNPARAVLGVCQLLAPFGVTGANFDLVTIDADCPDVLDPWGRPIHVETLRGDVVDTILAHAGARHVDLVADADDRAARSSGSLPREPPPAASSRMRHVRC